MNDKQKLLNQLQAYQPLFSEEQESLAKMMDFLQSKQENHFSRENLTGHMVAGAWLLDPSQEFALLTYHHIFDRWLQLGGHADGEANLLHVAQREAAEESGIEREELIVPINGQIFDVDAHFIPFNSAKNEPEHWHYEVRYLFMAQTTQIQISSESKALKWWSKEEIQQQPWEKSMQRMMGKWLNGATN